jgi:hypothetical protein
MKSFLLHFTRLDWFILGAILLIAISKMLFSAIQKTRKDETTEYLQLYCYLQSMIHNCEVNKQNFDYIMTRLIDLGQMKCKNREKTEVLTNEFLVIFIEFTKAKDPKLSVHDQIEIENINRL